MLPAELEGFPRVDVARNCPVFRQGEACENYYFVIEGRVKVFARSTGGKEIVLYRVEPGDICVLTTSCMLSDSRFPADAIAETAVVAIALPKSKFDSLMNESESFRKFLLTSFGARLSGLVSLVEQVALEGVERRLIGFILERAGREGKVLGVTHQDIATEIGSAREVVGRHLKALEEVGAVKLSRGSVILEDVSLLENLLEEKKLAS